jgi:hypothetical protein
MTETHNKGTGAGGSTTNHNGIAFENKTDNEIRLISNGFVRKNITGKEKTKYGYYLEKIDYFNCRHRRPSWQEFCIFFDMSRANTIAPPHTWTGERDSCAS